MTGDFLWGKQLFKILPLVVVLKAIVFQIIGIYRRLWRYTDVSEIIFLAKALAIPSLVFLLPRFFGLRTDQQEILAISYGVVVIDYLIALILLSTTRLARWYFVEQKNIKNRLRNLSSNKKRTLIIGAGEAALQLIRKIKQHPELGLEVIAALDDDVKKHGILLAQNIAVKGSVKDVSYWTDALSIDQIIIAIPSAKSSTLREIGLLCNETGADLRTIPGVDQLAGGQVAVEQIRSLSMEDLLGRAEINLNIPEVNAYLENKRVLITGAGGSIGSELCRQLVSKCNIASLCLLGKGENSIFSTVQEINHIIDEQKQNGDENPDLEIVSRIADIRNESRMDHIIAEFKPDVIFHAAAHKHVYLMEQNSCEAFENNVCGTRNVARLAGKNGVGTFVLISTDKAVNPTGVMGATKNLAEQTVLLTSKEFTQTRYTAVRFGNVLGSRGSVIQVWEKQLRDSKPITVTHKDAIRYFMTIPEASQLVIQAGAKAHSGEIMVLDMGTPIKIHDLAKQFIKLSGFDLDDVAIDIIGLKEGEKLYEELLTDQECIDSQLTDKIYKAKLNFKISETELEAELSKIEELAKADRLQELKSAIMDLVHNKQLV